MKTQMLCRLIAAVGGFLALMCLSDAQAIPPPFVSAFVVGPPIAQPAIRIKWTFEGDYAIEIDRQSPSTSWVGGTDKSGSIDDTTATPGVTRSYRGCVSDGVTLACSAWISVHWASGSGSSGSASGNPPAPSSQPQSPPPPPPLPQLTVIPQDNNHTRVSWPEVGAQYRLTSIVLTRTTWPAKEAVIMQRSQDASVQFDDAVPPNSIGNYRLCISNDAGQQCNYAKSGPKPSIPAAPDLVDVYQLALGSAARVTVQWKNSGNPGQYVNVERQDRVERRIEIVDAWRPRILNGDPNSGTVTVTPFDELGIQRGDSYRVCAIVPALGNNGRRCSNPRKVRQAADILHIR